MFFERDLQVYSEVLDHEQADNYGAETDALQSPIDIVECDDSTAAVRLPDGDFQYESWNRYQNYCEQVGNEPLQAIVVVHDGRISQKISLTSTTTHGSEKESRS
jgi:hypothetical protein